MSTMCFNHLLDLSLAFHTKRKTGEVLRILDRWVRPESFGIGGVADSFPFCVVVQRFGNQQYFPDSAYECRSCAFGYCDRDE